MICCGSNKKKKKQAERVQDEEDGPGRGDDDVASFSNSTSQSTMHDYIFSPKDFCESVHQKKLIPEFYLNGTDSNAINLRASQDGIGDESGGKRRSGLYASQGNGNDQEGSPHVGRNGLRASQGDIGRISPRASQGENAGGARNSLRASQGEIGRTSPRARNSLRISVGSDATGSDVMGGSMDGSSGQMTPRRAGARYSSFFSNTSYTNINYYEEFCALFPHFAIVPTEGFRVELGGRVTLGQELFLQEQDAHNLAYQRIFQKNDHNNFVGGDAMNPFIVSILACDDVEGGCRAIVRTKYRDHHLIVPNQSPAAKMVRHALAQVRKTDNSIPEKPIFNQIQGAFIVKDLSNFEEKAYKSKHKIGILYCKKGQTTEEEMFCNTEPSAEYLEFLDMIAERVPLRGFPIAQFAGGLDTKGDLTGTESYYTTFEGIEIMFHVSTLLPFAPDRPLQIERKKHIGNDVVCIVFMDSPTPFKPTTITSKFIHVIIVVQFLERNIDNQPVYRVSAASKPGVEPHHPILPTPPHFEGGEEFRKFLLTKAINSERAAAHAPAFKVVRTRMNSLATIVEKHTEEIPPKSCFG